MPSIENPANVIAPRVTPGIGVHGGTVSRPLLLELLSAKELASSPMRFGVDIPYTATPTGYGEWIPVFPNEAVDGYVVVLAAPTSVVV